MEVASTERKAIASISAFIILFIPTFSKVITNTSSSIGHIVESTWYWPWLTLIHKVPSDRYLADQWIASGLPWSIIVFFPFFYALRACYQMYMNEEKSTLKSLIISVAALGQLIIIFVMSKSQPDYINEEVSIYYIPQLALMVINVLYFIKHFQNAFDKQLVKAKMSKEEDTD
ncbi:MAG: hypothetical protein INQ03_05665 [Candidatus Heimdallarchaeota archaeon]|nr:hypothetical protein [Candidatus Heimdallarchaeota archaeon]